MSVFICLVIGFILLRITKKLIKKLVNHERTSKVGNIAKIRTIGNIFNSIIRAVILFVMLTSILDIFGINTSALIATAGIGGIALALASQSIIQDFIKGVFIILEDRIRVGDWVNTANAEGTVIEVNLRTIKIRDFNGSLHIIPNSQIEKIQNFNRGPAKADVSFRLSYETKLREAKEIIKAVGEEIKKGEFKNDFIEDFEFYEINSLDEFSYKIRMVATVKEGKQWVIGRKTRELIKLELEKKKISTSLVGCRKNEEI